MGQVVSATYESGKFLPKTSTFSNFFTFVSKKNLDQGRVGPIFTVGQKYALVRSGPGPSLLESLVPPLKLFVQLYS